MSDTVLYHRKKKKDKLKNRQRRNLNSRGHSPTDFESVSLTTRTRCLQRFFFYDMYRLYPCSTLIVQHELNKKKQISLFI